MSTSTDSASEIREEMRQVRSDMRENVQKIVARARVMTDWRHYVRTYPWVCLGGAAALGFWLVPARRPVVKPESLLELAKADKVALRVDADHPPQPSLVASLAKTAASSLFQIGTTILTRQLTSYLQDQALRFAGHEERPRQGGETP